MLVIFLKNIINNEIRRIWPKIDMPDFFVERLELSGYGDYYSNVAFVVSKELGSAPSVVALDLAREVQRYNCIEKIEVADPGFFNIYVDEEILNGLIPVVLAKNVEYGSRAMKGKRVLIEFVSANPTGPLHIGHARSAFLGDVLSRLLKKVGYEVSKEYYINDFGNQVEILANSIYKEYCALHGVEFSVDEEYSGGYIKEIAKEMAKKEGSRWTSCEYLPHFIEVGVLKNLDRIKKDLRGMHIEFDSWFSESELYEKGIVEEVMNIYRSKNLLYEANRSKEGGEAIRRDGSKSNEFSFRKEGGLFLQTSKYGDVEDRVVRRKNGTSVYLLADIAYHMEKFKRGFDSILNLWGADHAGHVGRLRAGIRALGLDDSKLEFILVQMVKLMKEGKDIKISKRAGSIIELQELVREIGEGASRILFMHRSPNSQFVFDIEKMKEGSVNNPVCYFSYGLKRMYALVEKSSYNGFFFNRSNYRLLREERELLKKVSIYHSVLEVAANLKEPHRILFYCQDLISAFHSYFSRYRNNDKILSADREKSKIRVGLIISLKIIVESSLQVLGIRV
ncbi:MAG: arginine--tRNA ligase [Deltaproteobacteria bacterium]|nr:MAG: arginine--tRNA ligase [Deltaproteobacteria bacterium]